MNIRRKRNRPLLSRIAPWALLALAVFFVGGFIAFRIWFYGYLKSESFRNLIGGLTSKQLKADGTYTPFSFADSAIYSDAYTARGTDEAPFSDLNANELRARINLAGLWRHAWQIDEINIQRLDLALGHPAGAQLPAAPPEIPQESYAVPSMPRFKWLPNHVDLRKVIIHETNLKWGGDAAHTGGINNAEFTITPDGDAWNISCDSGTIDQQGEPKLTIDQANLRYQHSTLFITDANLRYSSEGSIDVSESEINFGHSFEVQAKLNGIPVTPLLQPDWRAKLKGNLSGNVKVSSPLPMAGGPRIEGNLSLAQGVLEALPILDKISAFTGTERFRRVELTRVTADFTRTDSMLKVTNLIAESEGLIRMDGNFTVVDGMIDGNFQVGITPSAMEWLPAAMQTAVFTTSHDGYVWTTMHLTGPVGHPTEDLSSRLLAATPGALIDTGKKILDTVPGAGAVTDEGKKLIQDFLPSADGN